MAAPDLKRLLKQNDPESNEKVVRRQGKVPARGSRKPRGESSEELWLVSYADMMTLLVGFFAMLLAFSKIDAEQFERVKRETTKTFGGEYAQPFEDVSTDLKKVVNEQSLRDQVFFKETDEGLTITFRGALFFESGKSELRAAAFSLLRRLLPTIQDKAKNFAIVVEGHTDDIPINTQRFPSNWELSAVRAGTVLRLFEERGFPRNRLQAIGWADTKPIVPNRDRRNNPISNNQAQNRRVVIRIVRRY
jgi:chemotaxis protein MotB